MVVQTAHNKRGYDVHSFANAKHNRSNYIIVFTQYRRGADIE
jgi:hypothetical protein